MKLQIFCAVVQLVLIALRCCTRLYTHDSNVLAQRAGIACFRMRRAAEVPRRTPHLRRSDCRLLLTSAEHIHNRPNYWLTNWMTEWRTAMLSYWTPFGLFVFRMKTSPSGRVLTSCWTFIYIYFCIFVFTFVYIYIYVCISQYMLLNIRKLYLFDYLRMMHGEGGLGFNESTIDKNFISLLTRFKKAMDELTY